MPTALPHVPHNNRRAFFHDYKAPGTYMISISKAPGCPDFSTLTGNSADLGNNSVHTVLSPIGEIIREQISAIEDWPQFRILNHVVMPDHIHILWQVREWLPRDIGHYIGLFKARCTNNRRKGGSSANLPAVFTPKFNDRIAFSDELVQQFSKYIDDNPRRRRIAMLYPHLFTRLNGIQIMDKVMDTYGNFQLLKHPIMTPVIVSRTYTDSERLRHEQEWEETIRSGGVLISPFISNAEKEVMRHGIENGASVIRIIPEGLSPRYKPSGIEFDLCTQGRCLHIGPPRLSAHKSDLHRSDCLELNNLARWIASHPTNRMALLGLAASSRF